MAVFAGPEIVNNGLVLHLDAANDKSYPGSGTTWSDMSGNDITSSLINGTLYDSGNAGSLSFDGIDDYVNATDSMLNIDTGSIEVWVKVDDPLFNGSQQVVARTNVSVGTFNIAKAGPNASTPNGWRTNIRLAGTDTSYLVVSDSAATTDWTHIVATYDGTILKMFINGVQQLLTITASGTLNTGGTFALNIGSNTTGIGYFDGNIASVKIYNRALTAAEVKQNFEATRSRYGI